MSLIPDGLDDLKFDRLFSYLLTEEKHSKCNSEQKRRCTLNCHFDTLETSSGLYSPYFHLLLVLSVKNKDTARDKSFFHATYIQ